jgi:Ser/Thr protein kinase RdoA (MazF antagonist)
MEEAQIPFLDIARRALAEYEIGDCILTFIRHSDSATFKVERPGSSAYLLRIHVPVTRAMGGHGADAAAVNSELLWLETLSRDTDLVLQKPIRNRVGALVTQVPTADAALPVNCTLLQWVEGQPYHRDLESEHTAYQIGVILAKLHTHAIRWAIPEGFHRPKRDVAYFEGVLRGIQPALQDGRISFADYAELERSIALLIEMLGALNEDRQTHGLMHADVHKGNMLYHEGEIRLIDFSFCALGNFMFDLGICLSDMKESRHRAFLEGYQSLRALPAGHPRLIEGLFVGSMVGTFSFWVENPRAQEILARKVPQIARDYAARFNRGEHFWFA